MKKIILTLLLCLLLTGCKEKTYSITFNTMGGSILESITIERGKTLESIEEPVKEGYLFVTWLKDGVEYDFDKPITKDIELTASWIEKPELPEYYTVTFMTENHTEKLTVNENEKVKELTPPEKEGYIFIGWYSGDELYDFDTPVTKSFSLMAKYELNVVKVTYDLDGGYGLAIETIPKNNQVPIPETPTKEGYKFLKWTLNGKEFSFNTIVEEDITLKAVWVLIEHITVNFDTDGGNLLNNITLEKYSKINNLPTPEKEGYTFLYWELNNEKFNIDTLLEEDITLKAIYQENN